MKNDSPRHTTSFLSRLGSRRLALGLLLSSLTLGAVAHAKLASIGSGGVQFLAVGPAGLKIEGKTSKISASEAGDTVTVKVSLQSLATGIDMRDDHLKKALKVSAHPNAILTVKRSQLKFPDNDKTVEGSAKGQLTINGTAQPTTFQYKAKRTGSDYHIQGKVQVDITKHKIEIPCYLGVCVDKNVKVKVKFKVREQ